MRILSHGEDARSTGKAAINIDPGTTTVTRRERKRERDRVRIKKK